MLTSTTNHTGVYNGSKAALAAVSETWRHELQPLGVRTITLVTLAVKTDAFSRDLRTEIAKNSNYFEIKDFIHGLTDGQLQASGISTRQFATRIVREVEKGTAGPVWAGAYASILRLGWWMSPQFIRVSVVLSRSKGNQLIESTGYAYRKYYSCCQ